MEEGEGKSMYTAGPVMTTSTADAHHGTSVPEVVRQNAKPYERTADEGEEDETSEENASSSLFRLLSLTLLLALLLSSSSVFAFLQVGVSAPSLPAHAMVFVVSVFTIGTGSGRG